VSASHFRAKESGQISMFGIHTGVEDQIVLKESELRIDKREILDWERELLGLYVSDHPFRQYSDMLDGVVSHYSSQLAEASPTERVRVAGIVNRFRHHLTRSGKSMGFATIEDLQGEIELVIFSRTWERVSNLLEVDTVILADGRVDTSSAEPKILVDQITREFSKIKPIESSTFHNETESVNTNHPYMSSAAARSIQDDLDIYQENSDSDLDDLEIELTDDETVVIFEDTQETEILDDYVRDDDLGDTLSDYDDTVRDASLNHEESARTSNLGEPQAVHLSHEETEEDTEPSTEQSPEDHTVEHGSTLDDKPTDVNIPEEDKNQLPPFYLPPLIIPEKVDEIHMLKVQLRATGDKTRDELRLRRIHGIIISYPGSDRFAFHMFESGKGYLIEFPNYTVGICQEMLSRLEAIVGADNLQIEKITFQ